MSLRALQAALHMLCVCVFGERGGGSLQTRCKDPTTTTPTPRYTPVVFSRGLTDAVAVTVISCSLTLSHWASGAAPAVPPLGQWSSTSRCSGPLSTALQRRNRPHWDYSVHTVKTTGWNPGSGLWVSPPPGVRLRTSNPAVSLAALITCPGLLQGSAAPQNRCSLSSPVVLTSFLFSSRSSLSLPLSLSSLTPSPHPRCFWPCSSAQPPVRGNCFKSICLPPGPLRPSLPPAGRCDSPCW